MKKILIIGANGFTGRQIVNDLRLEIAKMLEDCGAVGNAEAQQLAA